MTNFFLGVALCSNLAVLPVQQPTAFDLEFTRNTIIEVLQESPRPELFTPEAVDLLVLTHIVESVIEGTVVKQQVNGGPAQGWFQMEPRTERDTWEHFLNFPRNHDLRDWVLSYASTEKPYEIDRNRPRDLKYNKKYQVAMVRIYYERRQPLQIDKEKDYVKQLSDFWKRNYNTPLGRGSTSVAQKRFLRYTGGFHD